jgi:hypothetical protein
MLNFYFTFNEDGYKYPNNLTYKSPQISRLPCDRPLRSPKNKKMHIPAKGNDFVEQFICCPQKGATPIQPHRFVSRVETKPIMTSFKQSSNVQSYRINYGRKKKKKKLPKEKFTNPEP